MIDKIAFHKIVERTDNNSFLDKIKIRISSSKNDGIKLPDIHIDYKDDLCFDRLNSFDYKNIIIDGLKNILVDNELFKVFLEEGRIESVYGFLEQIKEYIHKMDIMNLKPELLKNTVVIHK